MCDQINTIQKMAQKRAFIAATLIGCNASEYYTQDLEDLDTINGHEAAPSAAPIDTGGHPVGTQAAADHVARRKIEEMKRAPTPEPRRVAEEPAAPVTTPEQIPEQVQKMFALMKDFKSTLAVFAELKASLMEAIGADSGARLYYGILGKQGVDHANQFKSTKPARAAARELLEALEAANRAPVAGDEDLPDFGSVTEAQ